MRRALACMLVVLAAVLAAPAEADHLDHPHQWYYLTNWSPWETTPKTCDHIWVIRNEPAPIYNCVLAPSTTFGFDFQRGRVTSPSYGSFAWSERGSIVDLTASVGLPSPEAGPCGDDPFDGCHDGRTFVRWLSVDRPLPNAGYWYHSRHSQSARPAAAARGMRNEVTDTYELPTPTNLKVAITQGKLSMTSPGYILVPMVDFYYNRDPKALMAVITAPKLSIARPVPRCTVKAVPGQPGTFEFRSHSTDPSGITPLAEWVFPGGARKQGPVVRQSFTTPGSNFAQLLVSGSEATAQRSCAFTVPAPDLEVEITTPEGEPPFPLDEPIDVDVRVAVPEGIGAVNGIKFTGVDAGQMLGGLAGEGVTFTAGAVDPPVPADGFDLDAGEHQDFTVTLDPEGAGTYQWTVAAEGRSPASDFAPGYLRRASADSEGEVGRALAVDVALDPEEIPEQPESEDGPEPVTVDVDVTMTNNSGVPMTDVRLLHLTTQGPGLSALNVERVGENDIPLEGKALGPLAVGESVTYEARFRAVDDARVRFSALARGVRETEVVDLGVGRADWKVKPKYLLEVETKLEQPGAGTLLPAGNGIEVIGKVKNLSQTDTLKVGPLYPELEGNAGAVTFTWANTSIAPESEDVTGVTEFEPGEAKEFAVRVGTTASDPALLDAGPRPPTGGTRARLRFTPWAKWVDEEGVETVVEPERIIASGLDRQINIDDSVEIPYIAPAAYIGSLMVGGARGVKNGIAALALAPIDLGILGASSLHSIIEFQYRMWDSFSETEKETFLNDTAYLATEIMTRNATWAAMRPSELFDAAYEATDRRMTQMHNAWEVGDWQDSVETYSMHGADALTQVVVPLAMTKMANSQLVARAIARTQEALQTVFETTIGVKLADVRRIEELAPLLARLESGTELLPEQLEVLYGISADELAELQRLADKYSFLLTVRSRHASSLRWIERHAMLKPEALKIKSVSEMDHRLGYAEDDIGSLVFRKPEWLKRFEASPGADPTDILDGFLAERGFTPGSADYVVARSRLMDRTDEWFKYERQYRQWSKLDGQGHGFIDVSYNYRGNAIDDTVRKGTGQYLGFKLKPIAGEADAFYVELFDAKRGEWVRVTGDIDPIAFTNMDGTPIGAARHADLLDDMRKNPLLRGQHGESASFEGGGVKFISKQFKQEADGRFEAALQIAPGGHKPRVVRLNPGRSRWTNPRDYMLHWDGGFVYSGSYLPRGAIPLPSPAVATGPSVAAEAAAFRALPKSVNGEPNFGRFIVRHSNAPTAPIVVLGADDVVKAVQDAAADKLKQLVTTDIGTRAVAPGPVEELFVRPASVVAEEIGAGATRIPMEDTTGFEPGQTLVIGLGTDHPEEVVVVGFGSLLLAEPLRYDHAAGETIVVLKPREAAAPGAPAPIANLSPPAISGTALVGRTVTASAGTWDHAESFAHAWLADGAPFATGASLKLPARLAGKRLSAVVTASAPDRTPVAQASAAVVVKHGARIRLRAKGRRARVTVRAARGVRITGTVTVRGRKRVLGRARVSGTGRVRARIRLKRRGAVSASYSGSPTVAAART